MKKMKKYYQICFIAIISFSAICLTSCFGCEEKDSGSYNVSFHGRSEDSDGYIYQGRNIGLQRVRSGAFDYFPEYHKGTSTYVKVGGSFIKVSGKRFVSINYIDYYGI